LKKSNNKSGFLSKTVVYYSCWEDIKVIQEALKIDNNDTVLSITSAGCNIFNFLIYDPKKIYSVDYNPYQNYLLELKIEAIKKLTYNEFLEFLGIIKSNNAVNHYQLIRTQLYSDVQKFWDSKINLIKSGLLYFGKLDIKTLGSFIRFLKGNKIVENFFKCKSIDEQAEYYYKNLNSLPWRLWLKLYYNVNILRFNICLKMLSEFHYRTRKSSNIFRYLKKITTLKNPIDQIEYIFTKIPIFDNYLLSMILLNRYFNENFYPPYLKKTSFPVLKERIDRIDIKTSSFMQALKDLPDDSVTKFNLSNIFDWSDEKDFNQLFYEIKRVGKNDSRIFYSTTRKDRDIPEDIDGIYSEKNLASQLLKKDRTALYNKLHIGRITK
jgi:S-adenosylmethionine-diacylglycerol 3-amino-3-carboxypropyl transferase